MSYSDPRVQKAWRTRNPEKFRESAKRVNTRRRKEAVQVLRKYKDKPCTDCGTKYPYYVMQLDHRDPATKIMHPSLIPGRGWSTERMLEEFDKCDVVCANCHMERTHRQRMVLNSARQRPVF